MQPEAGGASQCPDRGLCTIGPAAGAALSGAAGMPGDASTPPLYDSPAQAWLRAQGGSGSGNQVKSPASSAYTEEPPERKRPITMRAMNRMGDTSVNENSLPRRMLQA